MAKIALVDDDEGVGLVLQEILKMRGHEVVFYPDGRSFLGAVNDGGIDLVITDMVMPTGGRAVIEKMAERGFPAPVIAVAGNMPNSLACELLAMGVHDAVQKPIPIEDLLELVEKWTHIGAIRDGKHRRESLG